MMGENWFIGECMLEMRPGQADATFQVDAAGDTYNSAVYLKRLNPAVAVRYISALGDDPVSHRIRSQIRAHGIDDTLVDTVAGSLPGLYLIETDADGERRFHYWRQQSAARRMLAPPQLASLTAAAADCACLVLSGISLAILDPARRDSLLALAATVRRGGGWVVIDNNFRPVLWPAAEAASWLSRAMAVGTHALLGFDDEAALYGDADAAASIARLRGQHPELEIVIKCGAAGCVVAPAGVAPFTVAAQPAVVRDSTAAGDSFNAAYVAARASGLGARAAAERGCQLAARVVAHSGAIIPAPAMADLCGPFSV